LFAMQLLDQDGHQAVAAHVRDCAFCRQELARMQGDLAACAYGIEMQSPPAAVRDRVMRQAAREKKALPPVQTEWQERTERAEPHLPLEEPTLEFRTRGHRHTPLAGAEKKPAPPDSTQRRSGHRFRSLSLWLGWAVAAGFAVIGMKLYQERESYQVRLHTEASEMDRLRHDSAGSRRLLDTITDADAQQVALSGTSPGSEEAAPEGRIFYAADKGALIFLANKLPLLQSNKTYELWLIPADGSDPVPAGVFHPDANGHGTVILPSLPKAIKAQAFGVTVEEENGSRSPTMPILMAGN
jgi:hypothetical protein